MEKRLNRRNFVTAAILFYPRDEFDSPDEPR